MSATNPINRKNLNKPLLDNVAEPRMKTIRIFAVVALIGSAHAAPSWASQLTSPAPGPHAPVKPVSIEYALSWNGQVEAGRVNFEFGSKGSTSSVMKNTCSGGSQGAAAKLFPYTFDMLGKVNNSSLCPILSHCNETDKEETKVTTVNFAPGLVSVREITRPHATGKDKVTAKSFSYSPVFDAFSYMLLIRSKKLDNGEEIVQVIQPFNTPYLAKISVLGREKINDRDAIKISISLTKIMSDLSLKPYKKMKTATLWLSDDPDRIPLELRVEAFIGDCRMTLVNKKPI